MSEMEADTQEETKDLQRSHIRYPWQNFLSSSLMGTAGLKKLLSSSCLRAGGGAFEGASAGAAGRSSSLKTLPELKN